MNALKMDFDEIFIRINLQKSEFFLIITVVAHDALLVGLDPGLGTATLLREGTNFGRGCSFSFFIATKRIYRNQKEWSISATKKACSHTLHAEVDIKINIRI